MSVWNYLKIMKSILQTTKKCWVCGSPYVEEHHVIYGTAKRKLSEKFGLKIYLCHEHHTGNKGVHFNKALDTQLKMFAQKKFEEKYSHEKFMEVFKKNYL